MDHKSIAQDVLKVLGGTQNIRANGLCATRLRVVVHDRNSIDLNQLGLIAGVLGTVRRGSQVLEIVFGPGLVCDVFNEFSKLTGLDSDTLDTEVLGKPEAMIMKVQVAADKKRGFDLQAQQSTSQKDITNINRVEDLLNKEAQGDLEQILEAMPQESTDAHNDTKSVLVINGPNINMLGIREPKIYGNKTYDALLDLCHTSAREFGFSDCKCIQSNHEGDLVDAIQDAYGLVAGIVINPGAYTHTSIALLDALKAVQIPAVEVHISKLDDRESFRQISYIRDYCFTTVQGQGVEGYRTAIKLLAQHLGI